MSIWTGNAIENFWKPLFDRLGETSDAICTDCGRRILFAEARSKRCARCYYLNHDIQRKQGRCEECGTPTCSTAHKKCKSCSQKARRNAERRCTCGVVLRHTGTKQCMQCYRSRPTQKHRCPDCGYEVTRPSARCQSCAAYHRIAKERAA